MSNRMEQARKSLPVYEKIEEYVSQEIVVPYDDYLIEFLSTNTTKDEQSSNYLNLLCSTKSIGNCYTYARYLALGMKGDFELCEGNLSGLYGGYFPHAWVETKEYVYDVAFIGKWPKEVYYQLFKPIDVNVIDINRDDKFRKYKNNSIKAKKKADPPLLKFIHWYGYTSSIMSGWQMNSPVFGCFPRDEEKEQELKELAREKRRKELILEVWNEAIRNREKNYIEHPFSDWNPSDSDNNDEIPSELLSQEFFDALEGGILKELCILISLNRETYDKCKYDSDFDIWRKALKGGYSGSLCIFTEKIPIILAKIEKNKKRGHTR